MLNKRDNPWIFRTYSGHSTAQASNELFRKNLAKGQTGLSVAFDLPTQLGLDADHPLARGEVGKVGVPIGHIGDMERLFAGIPLAEMNTSLTINATASWLLALLIAVCERQGGDPKNLKGTTQNDILKEYLSRGTYIFPPAPSLKLTTDVIVYAGAQMPKFNPVNVCPYHLQEAGATPVQEIAFGLANAVAILDTVRRSDSVSGEDFFQIVGRVSFFLDSSLRFIEEMCKTKAFAHLWDKICKGRYGVSDENLRRFRYGVQVNSLNLTEAQPENNIVRIIYELLGVTLSRAHRARAVQLPAWNEAIGLPRPWDQQLSLRVQQILAYETDLLEYDDVFAGSFVVKAKVEELVEGAERELQKILDMGGALAAIQSGYMKTELVRANGERLKAIEEGRLKVVGVNCFTETDESPLAGGLSFLRPDDVAEREQIELLHAFRERRDGAAVDKALKDLRRCGENGENIMPVSIACAHAGVTTGEWGESLRQVFGEYRAPTGVAGVRVSSESEEMRLLRDEVKVVEKKLQTKLRFLVAKPGLDGHSSGAEQIALKARDLGIEVIYQGIRTTPASIVQSALQEDVHLIGLSILSGAHGHLVREVLEGLRAKGLQEIPVVVGGIIPKEDEKKLLSLGVKKIFTPKDFELNKVFSEILRVFYD